MNLMKKAWENIFRNWLTTLPTVFVIAMVLTMFHGLLLIHEKAQNALRIIQDKFSITVYLRDDADPFEIGNLITTLEARPDVKKPVLYISKEAAWQLMTKTFSLDNELLKKYKFSLPASLTITPRRIEAVSVINAYLETHAKALLRGGTGAEEKQKQVTQQMLEFIKNIKASTIQTIFFFIVFFMVSGSLLIGSTIHMAFTSHHREIAIMKLVGASRKTIMAPFILEAFFISLLSFLLHLFFLSVTTSGFAESFVTKNSLLFELAGVVTLALTVSAITTLLHMRKKSLFAEGSLWM